MPGFTPPNDAGNKPRDYIGLADLRDIKAALHGKPVDATGKVDHAAKAATPHLRLSATWYTSQMKDLAAHKDRQQMMGLIDVVNLFIMEQSVSAAEQYGTELQAVRALVGPDVALVAGAFLFNSAIDWADPASFRAILNASIGAYDAGEIEGMMWYSGSALSHGFMNATRWQEWHLPETLAADYWPWMGTVHVRVQSQDGSPVANASAVVTFGAKTHVARKLTASDGTFSFGGWQGKAARQQHRVSVSKDGVGEGQATVQVIGGKDTNITLTLKAQRNHQGKHRFLKGPGSTSK